MKDRHGLLSKPIGQVLLKMSLHNLVGLLTILGFSLVDTFFISKLGTDALAAISFTFPVTLVVTSIGIGIGAGVSINLGRLIGSGDSVRAKVFLQDALLFTLILIVFVSIAGSLCIDWLFGLLGADGKSLMLIHDYLFIWYFGAPLLVLMMVGNQALRATGDTRSPAKIMAFAALTNLVLDPILIFGLGPFPRLGIQGAAIATVISWLLALSASSYLLVMKKHLAAFIEYDLARLWYNWKKLAKIAQPAMAMNILNPVANAMIMAMLARIDHNAVAAFGVGIRLESILLVVVISLSSTLVPFIAQNLGAGQPQRARQALMLSLKFVLIFQAALYLPLLLLANLLAHTFSSDPLVIDWLVFYITFLPIAYGPLGMIILVATSLNAYHRPLSSLMLNICRLFLIMLPLAALGAMFVGVKGVMLALPVTNILMGSISYLLAKQISEPAS